MADPIEREVPALLHQLAVENGRLVGEIERLREALRAILAEARPPFSYGSAFDNCQRIAAQALATEEDTGKWANAD